MGRSAKLMKRPTQKQKAASKIVKAASKPVPTPAVVSARNADPTEEAEGAGKGGKKRKMMRVKVDQVCFSVCLLFSFLRIGEVSASES